MRHRDQKIYILGFATDKFDKEKLDSLTQEDLYGVALKWSVKIYHDLESFLGDLNSQRISTDKYWFYQYRLPMDSPEYCCHVSFGYETPMLGRQIYRVVTDSAEERDELAMDIVSLHGTTYVKKGDGPGRKDKRINDISVEDYRRMFCHEGTDDGK